VEKGGTVPEWSAGDGPDAASAWYELGRQLQAVALAMRRHRVIPSQGLCECGRLPIRRPSLFGQRCDIAYEQWSRTHEAMRRMLATTDFGARAVGRAAVDHKAAAKARTREDE